MDQDGVELVREYLSSSVGKPFKRLVPRSEYVSEETVPAVSLREPVRLEQAIREAGATLRAELLPVAASLWVKAYVLTVVPYVLGTMSVAGTGVDASAENVGIRFRDGIAKGFVLYGRDVVTYPLRLPAALSPIHARTVSCAEDLRRLVTASLFEAHLSPLFDVVRRVSRLSQRAMWVSAGEAGFALYDRLMLREGVDDARAALAEDRAALLDSPLGVTRTGANPLYGTIEYVIETRGEGQVLRSLRRICCLKDQISGRKACDNCPHVRNRTKASPR